MKFIKISAILIPFPAFWGGCYPVIGQTVAPGWYETWTFFVFCAVLLMAIGLLAGRWRQREHERRRRELEVQTEELSDALAKVVEQAAALEELDAAKSRFFANISHEFRTPLTVILGALKDALAGRFGNLTEKLTEQHHAMLRSTRRLQGLIEQVLDLNRLESGHLGIEPAPGDLVQFLRHLVEASAPLAERNGIDLTLGCEAERCPRLFDEEKLEKIVGNLLSNALKFTPRHGKVRVILRGTDEVEIAVADNGPGIPPEAQEQVFERFVRLEEDTKHGGTGIGLALAHELARLHGGTIALESEPEEGSTFTARLPLEKVDLSDLPDKENPGVGPADELQDEPFETGDAVHAEAGGEEDRTTVLIIEDNDDVRAYIRRLLEERYRIFEAVTGKSGLAVARRALPDLIVTDVMLPRIDGYEIARQLKAEAGTECIPVVMLTARAAVDDHVEGYESGAEAYLVKPFNPDALRAVVGRLFRERLRLRRHLRQELRSHLPAQADTDHQENRAPKTGNPPLTERVRRVILTRLYDKNLAVRELASLLSISRSTLYRGLKEEIGLSPGAFIHIVRLEKALELLSNGAGSVSEVAYAVGFKSLSHFTRRFREHYGKLPSTVLDAKE